jgi:hypothetical protein
VKRARLKPVHWGVLFFILAQALTFATITRENRFLEKQHISLPPQAPPNVVQLWPPPPPPVTPGVPPQPAPASWSALGPILIYFAAVMTVLGAVLFLVPVSILRSILRALFAFLFAWGLFIVLIFWLPVVVTAVIAISVGLIWFLIHRVWLHDAVMIIALVSLGAVFGRFIPPWVSMVLLLILAAYDFLAVRFGYMVWMVKRLSDSDTLPALVLPRLGSDWSSNLKQSSVTRLVE